MEYIPLHVTKCDVRVCHHRSYKEEKLSKFIVDWENGTQVACNNGADLARNVH